MKRVVTADEMRAYEAARFADGRAYSLTWMERAAAGVDAVLAARYAGKRALVLCGGGNNGGDGLALLRLLKNRGAAAEGVLFADPALLRGDAKTNFARALECGAQIGFFLTDEALARSGVVVDALFGTGLSRPLSGAARDAAERINASGKPVVAVDIPSGVDATTGAVLGEAVRADVTVTFEFYKRGQLLFPGRARCGEVVLVPLSGEADDGRGDAYLFEKSDAAALLPPRALDAHKGAGGRALLCVGSERLTGAALLSVGAALRAGAGLVTAAVPGALKSAFSLLPEAMAVPVSPDGEWGEAASLAAAELLAGKSAVGIGCGVGTGDVLPLLTRALESRLPLLVDADALNQLSRRPELLDRLHENVVLTPHPAEMARLTGEPIDRILADPIEIARIYAARWGCVVLLKGATTCVSDGRTVRLNASGNPGLAKGGSGDVLSGLITAMLSQGLKPYDAASAGAYLLGASADAALELLGTRMLMARDVIEVVEKTIEGF